MGNDLTKVYQFLASYGSNNAWVGHADKNGDGIVIKGEFTEFVNNEYKGWNGNESGETLSADIINDFWRKIDTNVTGKVSGSSKSNKNALDKDEQEALNKKIEAYVELSSFVKNNVKAPSVLTTTASQWKAAVTEELGKELEKLIKKGIKTEEIQEKLQEKYDEIYNGQTALFCAAEYQNTLMKGILKTYPDYKVADDSTLNSLINAYLKTIDTNATPSDIMSAIKEIMNAYLATAGICKSDSKILSTLGYAQNENDKLNGIQESVVRSTLKKTLESIKSEANYEKYKEYYDKAIEEFINSKVSAATFKEFKTLQSLTVDDFKGDKAYQGIQNRINFDDTFKNINLENLANNALYKALETKVGKTLAERILSGNMEFPAYETIITAVTEKFEAGEFLKEDGSLDMDAIVKYITDELVKNLSSFTSGAFGNEMSLEDLKKLYDNIVKNTDSITDANQRAETIKQAAIDYCDAVAKKSDQYKKAVIEAFGDDWASAIRGMLSVDVKNKMTTLIEAVGKLIDPSNLEVIMLPDNKLPENMITGSTIDYQFSPIVKVKNDNETDVDSTKIGYNLKSASPAGCATLDPLGKLTITAGSTRGYINISVEITYDGQVIDTKEIKITVKDVTDDMSTLVENAKWSNDTKYGLSGTNTVYGMSKKVNECEFKDLYNKNKIIELGSSTDLTNITSAISGALESVGLDASKLSTAIETVAAKYKSNVKWGGHEKHSKGGDRHAAANRLACNAAAGHHGIAEGVCYNKAGGQKCTRYAVSFKNLVDDILEEYKRLSK